MATRTLTPRELTVASLYAASFPPNDAIQVDAAFFTHIGHKNPTDCIMRAAELTGLCIHTLRTSDEVPQKIGI